MQSAVPYAARDVQILTLGFCIWVVSTLSSMAGMSIGSAIFFVAFCWFFYRNPERNFLGFLLRDRLFQATLVFSAIATFSLAYSYWDPPLGVVPDEWFGLPRKLRYLFFPFAVALTLVALTGPRGKVDAVRPYFFERHLFWRWLFRMSVFVCLVSIPQIFARWIFPEDWLTHSYFRPLPVVSSKFHIAQGLMEFHLSFATVMCFTLAYSLGKVFWPSECDSTSDWLKYLCIGLLSMVILFFTFSRITWLAMPVILMGMAFLKKPAWAGRTLLASIGVLAIIWFSSDDVRVRMRDGVGIESRITVWQAAWQMVKDRPLVGVGFEKTGLYAGPFIKKTQFEIGWFRSHAHNNILSSLAGMGVPGLMVYLLWWGTLFWIAWRVFCESRAGEKWLAAGCLVGGLAFQLNGITQINFFDAKSMHGCMLWAGIVLALEWRRQWRAEGARETSFWSRDMRS